MHANSAGLSAPLICPVTFNVNKLFYKEEYIGRLRYLLYGRGQLAAGYRDPVRIWGLSVPREQSLAVGCRRRSRRRCRLEGTSPTWTRWWTISKILRTLNLWIFLLFCLLDFVFQSKKLTRVKLSLNHSLSLHCLLLSPTVTWQF